MGELAPGQTLDQYRLEDIVARSGMATIFRARDLDTGRTVVLKVPHLQYESDLVFHDRFLREEEIGLRLDHPAVIRVFRPRTKSRVYIAMEWVHGELLPPPPQPEKPPPGGCARRSRRCRCRRGVSAPRSPRRSRRSSFRRSSPSRRAASGARSRCARPSRI